MSLKTVSRRTKIPRGGRMLRPFEWVRVNTWACSVKSKTHTLVVNVIAPERGMFMCGAVTVMTPNEATTQEDVFDHHAHDALGTFKTFPRARLRCERFIKKWWREQKKLERCACKPIAKKRKR